MDDTPMLMERGFITELMTDEEIDSLNDAVELALNDCDDYSDEIIATEISKALWIPIAIYIDNLKDYYGMEDDFDAEQDT